jgi:hypothetical protein
VIAPKISTRGARLIAAERQRQISQEGWTPEHDDEHDQGELAGAAVCYVLHALQQDDPYFEDDEPWPIPQWPWAVSYWKPSDDPIRNLVKAGALIAAEIDRLQRAEDHNPEPVPHPVFPQPGSNLCVCGESTEAVVHQANQERNPFDEHTRMWEDEIRGMGLNPDVVRNVAEEAKPYVEIPFGDVRGLPAFDPEVLEEVRRFYENNGREMQ